ncbi:hypothetical protein R6Q57_023365 [Mikania cordata]
MEVLDVYKDVKRVDEEMQRLKVETQQRDVHDGEPREQIDVLNKEELDVPEYVKRIKEKGQKSPMNLEQWQLQRKLVEVQFQQDLKEHQEWLQQHFQKRKELLQERRLQQEQHLEQHSFFLAIDMEKDGRVMIEKFDEKELGKDEDLDEE